MDPESQKREDAEDLTDLVPSDAVLAQVLKLRKVEPGWYDDEHPLSYDVP